MRRFELLAVVAILAAGVLILPGLSPTPTLAQAGASAFTYQGRLNEGSQGVDAPTARLEFRLWDSETGGQQIGAAWVSYPVEISGGIFTTLVDFGESAFAGEARWLEIRVDVTGGTSYTLLEPRQRLSAAPMAVHAMHGGDNPWEISGSNISYLDGNVGIGTGTPTYPLSLEKSQNSNIVPMAQLRTTGTNSTASLRFMNGAGNHYNLGITGNDELALGYNANVPLTGDLLRITSDGKVGIGKPIPTSTLDVDGTVTMTGLKLGTSASAGYVLTSDAQGNGTWQPSTGGGGFWSGGSGGVIYYLGGNVGIGSTSPNLPLLVYSATAEGAIKGRIDGDAGTAVEGRASATTGETVGVHGSSLSSSGIGVLGQHVNNDGYGTGVRGTSASPYGYAVFAENASTSGTAIGLFGKSNSPTGFGGYFIGKGYFTGSVGIGTTTPASALEVEGTVTTDGLRLGTAATPGHVLTADASGNGTWQAPPEAESIWENGAGGEIYYEGGNVGIGTADPEYPLHVLTDHTHGGYLHSIVDTGDSFGVYGRADGDAGGVLGANHYGVYGVAKHGYNNAGVYGSAAGGTNNWGGYFQGMLYASGNAGIGNPLPTAKLHVVQDGDAEVLRIEDEDDDTTPMVIDQDGRVGLGTASPQDKLHVNGTVRVSGFRMASGYQSGYVLTSDATGSGTWQPPFDGLALPYSGTISEPGPAFSISNTGEGTAIYCQALAGNSYAGSFTTSGTSSSAIRGVATGPNGRGVYAEASGGGPALKAVASGASEIGIEAHGSDQAAAFYGNVILYDYGTTTAVLELGKGLDYAEGFDFREGEQDLSKGTVVIIDPENPGRLTRSVYAYDRRVAGIVAGAEGLGSGVRLGAGQFDHDVALAGRVYCNVVATDDEVQPGDLLTTSDIPGYAMKVTDFSKAPGAVLGKAMEPLAKGERGRILVLVTLQ